MMSSEMMLILGMTAFFGLFFGSFLNVVVMRLDNEKEPFWKGRSRCNDCGHELQWYDLIALVSFLQIRGKCRYCRVSLPWQYPLVELLTSLAYTSVMYYWLRVPHGFPRTSTLGIIALTVLFFYVSQLIVIFVYDAIHKMIPELSMWINMGLAVLYQSLIFIRLGELNWDVLVSASVLALVIFGFYFFTKKRGMGFGDIELVFSLGLLISWEYIWMFFVLSFMIGSIYGIVALILQRVSSVGAQVPFGPALILAFWFIFFFPQYAIRLNALFFVLS
jgi:leader peptidase (prepilin peptidase)/N-methyltransferase